MFSKLQIQKNFNNYFSILSYGQMEEKDLFLGLLLNLH